MEYELLTHWYDSNGKKPHGRSGVRTRVGRSRGGRLTAGKPGRYVNDNGHNDDCYDDDDDDNEENTDMGGGGNINNDSDDEDDHSDNDC